MRLSTSFHPGVKAVRVALATGAIAGLVALGACAENAGKSITAPGSGPRNATIFGGGYTNAGHILACVEGSSPAGTYKFTNTGTNNGLDLDGNFDGADGGDGTWTTNVPDNTEYVVGVGACVTIFTRLTPDSDYPDFQDTWSGTTITATTIPATAVYDSTNCNLDLGTKAAIPNPCGVNNNPTKAYVNFDHGSEIHFFFGQAPPPPTGCTFTQGYYKNHDSYTASVLANNAGTTYVDGAGKLLIGSYHLTAAQVDDILSTPVAKGYNSGGVVFTAAQLGMIHQLITAELNVTGGADPTVIASTIAAANAGYTSASKAQLSAWTDALANYNEGITGPGHCSD